MTITSLMDDYCPSRGLRGEHGLSLFIETKATKLLLDAGQSSVFLENAKFLGIDLSSLDAVVLSHGHYDHGGGLEALYAALYPHSPPFIAGKGFDVKRLSKSEAGLKDIGVPMPISTRQLPVPTIIETIETFASGIHLLCQVKMIDEKTISPRFRRIQDGSEVPDDFEDELSLVVEEDDGIVVVTGCAHRGIVNISRAAMRTFPGKHLKALVGGFHLVDATQEQISRTVDEIVAIDPGKIICAHCTGLAGFAALSGALRGRVSWLSCGKNISIS